MSSSNIIEASSSIAIANPDANAVELALACRNYSLDHLSYVLDGWDDASTVLSAGQGSCSEYSMLFSALARSNGLPTRFIGSALYLKKTQTDGTVVY